MVFLGFFLFLFVQKTLRSLEHLFFPRALSQQIYLMYFPGTEEQDGSLALNFLLSRNHWNMNRILIKAGSSRGQGHMNCLQISINSFIPDSSFAHSDPVASSGRAQLQGGDSFGHFWHLLDHSHLPRWCDGASWQELPSGPFQLWIWEVKTQCLSHLGV